MGQKLFGRDTYTPWGAPQAPCSVTLKALSDNEAPLNREETLSEQSLKTPYNNPDVDQLQRVGDQNLRVSDTVHASFKKTWTLKFMIKINPGLASLNLQGLKSHSWFLHVPLLACKNFIKSH